MVRELREAMNVRKDIFHPHPSLIDSMERAGVLDEETVTAAILYLSLDGDWEFAGNIGPSFSDRIATVLDVYKDFFLMTDTLPLLMSPETGPLKFVMAMVMNGTEDLLEEIADQEKYLRAKALERKSRKSVREQGKKHAAKDDISGEFDEKAAPQKTLTEEERVENSRTYNYSTMAFMASDMIDMVRRLAVRGSQDLLPVALVDRYIEVLREACDQLDKYDSAANLHIRQDFDTVMASFERSRQFSANSPRQFGIAYTLPAAGAAAPKKLVMKYHAN